MLNDPLKLVNIPGLYKIVPEKTISNGTTQTHGHPLDVACTITTLKVTTLQVCARIPQRHPTNYDPGMMCYVKM